MRLRSYNCFFLIIASLIILTSCSSATPPYKRINSADIIALQNNWTGYRLKTSHFSIQSYIPTTPYPDEVLTIFIEGDGYAWKNRTTPSTNPTPINPLVLKMAIEHPEGNVAYLGRPCQYMTTHNCQPKYWLTSRFSPLVLAAMNDAVNQLKKTRQANKVRLIGYSGGAALASILSNQRTDVVQLVTIAGNLDHAAWTSHHQISPLRNSLNPANFLDNIATHQIPQIHIAGYEDSIIPPTLIEEFINKQTTKNITFISIAGYDHHCCWDQNWPSIWETAISLKPGRHHLSVSD